MKKNMIAALRAWLRPRGMASWKLLADTLNREPLSELGWFFMAMLKPLGVEKRQSVQTRYAAGQTWVLPDIDKAKL